MQINVHWGPEVARKFPELQRALVFWLKEY